MTDAQNLLAQYASEGSESAFRELVARYVDFVYSTALRLVGGDAHWAQDVTQVVFIDLAKNGRVLSPRVMLGGWLHQHTFHVAMKSIRSERRRQTREREAMEMNDKTSDVHWQNIAPILDEAITQLGKADRTAILLRFFEQRDFRAVAEAIGGSEDAARMRVNRALEKLHGLLLRRGVALSAVTLATALTTKTLIAAPIGLAASVSTTALAGAGTAGTLTILKFMAATKLKLAVTTLVVVGATTALLIEHRSQSRLRRENYALLQQLAQSQTANQELSNRMAQSKRTTAPRIPAPPLQSSTANLAPMEALPTTNVYALLTNKPTKLTAEQIAPYLLANNRSAASLLAGFRTTGDKALLEEAMQKFPKDPQVAFEAAFRKDAPPEERRRWLDALRESAPDNPLANYLSAYDYFKSGQTDKAIEDLLRVSDKTQLQDFSADRIQNDEEAYRAAGYSVAEAKSVACSQLLLPHLIQLRDLGRSVVDLAGSYQQAGDESSRQAALQIAIGLGQRYGEGVPGQPLISQLVGIAIERTALEEMDPVSAFDSSGQTAQERLNQVIEQRAAYKRLATQVEPMWPQLTEADWVSYHSRSMLFGELAAMRWVAGKYGAQ